MLSDFHGVKLATMNASLAENVPGMGVIHIFNQEAAREEKFDQMNIELREAERLRCFTTHFLCRQ